METKQLILAILVVLACLLPVINDSKSDRAKKSSRPTPFNAVIAEDVTPKDLKEYADDQNSDRREESSEPVFLNAVVVEDEALKELRRNAFLLKYHR